MFRNLFKRVENSGSTSDTTSLKVPSSLLTLRPGLHFQDAMKIPGFMAELIKTRYAIDVSSGTEKSARAHPDGPIVGFLAVGKSLHQKITDTHSKADFYPSIYALLVEFDSFWAPDFGDRLPTPDAGSHGFIFETHIFGKSEKIFGQFDGVGPLIFFSLGEMEALNLEDAVASGRIKAKPLDLAKSAPAAAATPVSPMDADGTPKAWLVRPGEDIDQAGLGAFTRQILEDGMCFDLTDATHGLVEQGLSDGLDHPPYRNIYAAGHFYVWLVESFGNSAESLGKVGLICGTLFYQALLENIGFDYEPVGDEGLLYELELDDFQTVFGQMDGPDALILMLPDDAHMFQLFDLLGRELPPRGFGDDLPGLSLEKL